jgi:hypothetical protein
MDNDIKLAFARLEYRSVRIGSPTKRTALVTSSETSNSAASAVSIRIPLQESRKKRVYRRAQNGEVGSVTSANVPESSGRRWLGWAVSQADPIAGPASGRASDVIVARLDRIPVAP